MCVTIFFHLLDVEIEIILRVATIEAAPTASAAKIPVMSMSISSISIPSPTPTNASDSKSNSARSSLTFGGQGMVWGLVIVVLFSYWT